MFKDLFIKHHVICYFAVAIVYAIVYNYIFRIYIIETWNYMLQTPVKTASSTDFLLYILLVSIPILFYNGIRTVASSLSLFVHTFAYVPIVNSLMTLNYNNENQVISYVITFFVIMIVFFKTDNIYLMDKFSTVRQKWPFKFFVRISFVVFILLVLTNLKSLRYVNFFADNESMYDFREINGNAVSVLYGYFFCWTKFVSLPIIYVYYLKKKSIIGIVSLIFAFFIAFMIDMQKVTFFMPFIIAGAYLLYVYCRNYFRLYFFYVLIGVLILLSLLLSSNLNNPIVYVLASVFIMRTMCMEGILFDSYFTFFEINNNDYTYFTHVNIVNAIFGGNPYAGTPIGQVVSAGEANANACFWLMDGITSCGLTGVVLSSIVFVLFKSCFNCIGKQYNSNLLMIILLFSITAMVNVSLFTSLLTYGFLLFYFVFIKIDFSWINK